MNLAEIAIRKKTITLVITILMIGAGLYSFTQLGRLEDPEFTIKDAKVVTQYPGATPREVEQEVTDILETAIQEMPQLDYLVSTSEEGLSIITPTIKDKYDKHTLPQVWDELRRKVSDAQEKLPPGVKPSIVNDDFGDVFGLFFAVTGEDFSYRELKDYVDDIRKELLLISGVTKIEMWGIQQETIYVEISRAKMAQLGISPNEIYTILGQQNLVYPAGQVRVGDEYITISSSGDIDSVDSISNLIIRSKTDASKLIYLKDIAKVYRGYETPPKTIMRFNGKKSIAMGVAISPDENVVKVGQSVIQRINELKNITPLGINIETIYNQATEVKKSVNSFLNSLLQAVVIVIIVLLIFMGLRSGLLIGGMLLLTILGTFIFMDIYSITLQRISLGALIIALGMLVDNAIVVTDGILVRIESGEDAIEAAKKVVAQTMWPLLGATLVAILAFSMISMSQDSTGEYTATLFQVMLISLLLSWIIAVTITPLFCVYCLKAKPGQQHENPYEGKVYKIYQGFLSLCIRFRYITVLVTLGLLGAALIAFGYVDQSFFPDSTMKEFMVDFWRPQGTDIRATDQDIQEIEKHILAMDGIKSVSSFVGAGATRFTLIYAPEDINSSYAQLLVTAEDHKNIQSEYIPAIREYLAENYPDSEPDVKKFRMGTGAGFLIQIRFSGPDPAILRQIAEQAMDILRRDGGSRNIRTDWRQRVKVVEANFSENKARRAGISRQDLQAALQNTFTGVVAGLYREDNELIPIISRSPEEEHNNIESIQDIQIWSPLTMGTIPIGQVVNGYEIKWRDPILKRRNRKLTITVQADPKDGSASNVLNRTLDQIRAISLPPGYAMEMGGEYEDSEKAQAGIYKNIPPVLIAMILLVVILFNALRQPAIIWLSVPLALIGVSFGLLLTNQSFGFMALLGFLSLSGMLIKNSIVLLDQIDLEISEGKQPYKAIIDSSVGRMRPVSMAAITTILGMTPLLFDVFFVSMAVTIMFGLLFATLLTLIVVPTFYAIFFKIDYVKS